MNERISVTDRVTIYHRGKKKLYTADFWYQNQHRRQSLKTSNLKEAKERALKLDHQLRHGDYSTIQEHVAISEGRDQFLAHKRTEGRAARTLTRYTGELNTFVEFANRIGIRTLTQITPTVIDRYRSERLQDHHIATVNHETEVIRQLLAWSVSRKLLKENPMERMKFQKPKRDPQPAMKHSDLEQVIKLATPRLRFILSTLMMTGCRIGELQHLLHQDVDLEGGWIHIMSRPGAETKTRLSRKIPIHPRLKELLTSKSKAPGSWYFCAEPSDKYPAGDHTISPKRINEEFQSLLKRCHLKTGREQGGYTLHSLRHFFETECVNSGVPQVMVDRWMGHSSRGSMGRVYYDNDDVKSREFMARVDFPGRGSEGDT
jgi:integrase